MAVETWHDQISQYDVDTVTLRNREGVDAVCGGQHVVSLAREQTLEKRHVCRRVVGDEDGPFQLNAKRRLS